MYILNVEILMHAICVHVYLSGVPEKYNSQLYRPDQSLIFQFRTGHAAVNMHLNPVHAPMCRHFPILMKLQPTFY